MIKVEYVKYFENVQTWVTTFLHVKGYGSDDKYQFTVHLRVAWLQCTGAYLYPCRDNNVIFPQFFEMAVDNLVTGAGSRNYGCSNCGVN